MENLLLLFENISSVNRALIMVSGITFFWIIEGIVPFKLLDYKKYSFEIDRKFESIKSVDINPTGLIGDTDNLNDILIFE